MKISARPRKKSIRGSRPFVITVGLAQVFKEVGPVAAMVSRRQQGLIGGAQGGGFAG